MSRTTILVSMKVLLEDILLVAKYKLVHTSDHNANNLTMIAYQNQKTLIYTILMKEED